MNVDVVGRVRPTLHGEGVFNLEVDSQNRLATGPGGNYFSFLALYKQDTTNHDLHKKVVDPLLELFIAGYNVSLLFAGETGSGKTFTMAGEGSKHSGIVPITLENLFQRVKIDDEYMYDNKLASPTRVHIQMFEIFSDQVRDLLAVPKSIDEYSELEECADVGIFVKHATTMPLRTVNDSFTAFQQGWGRRSASYTDFGPANNYTAVVVRLELETQGREDPFPHRSRFTFVELPGLEKLSEDSTEMRLREGPLLNKGLLSFSETIAHISVHSTANRVVNYGGSKLTQLLRDEIGGNCKTRVVMCLKPNTESRVLSVLLTFAEHTSKVRNFPVRNDTFLQQLIIQYRAEVLDLKRQLGHGLVLSNSTDGGDIRDQMRKLQTDNLQLRDKNERLHYRLNQVQNKFGNMAQDKSDLSGQLLMTEDEKLKVSKTLVDLQIENNRLLEDLERTKFDLTNKIIRMENEAMNKDSSKEKYRSVAENARKKLEGVERDRRDLADEYVTLKTNYLSLTEDHKVMSAKLDDLCMELLNLVNAKVGLNSGLIGAEGARRAEWMGGLLITSVMSWQPKKGVAKTGFAFIKYFYMVILMKQVINLEKKYGAVGESLSRDFGSPEKEVERVRAMIERVASKKFDHGQFQVTARERENFERQVFGNEERFEGEIEKMRVQYGDQQAKLNYRIQEINQELTELRQLVRERQQRISELNAQLISSKSDNDDLRKESRRLQNKMKDLSDEYKSRLNKWVEDIADYVDTGTGLPGKKTSPEKYKEFIDQMLKDIKKAHKFRETQLSEAAANFRQKAIDTTRKHEQLLVAYGKLRQEVQRAKVPNIELGPDDSRLMITDEELTIHNQKEVARLKDALASAEVELEALKSRKGATTSLKPGSKWLILRKHLRDFTLNTVTHLMNDRAELWSENLMLKEQLTVSQEYIDNDLVAYKAEISRLRDMLGMPDVGSRMNSRMTRR